MSKMKTTKTMILTVLIAASALLTSCSKDDDNDPSIVGTWLQTEGTSENFLNGVSQGVENDVIDANNYWKITINADGTFSEIYVEDGDSYEDSGTYTVVGNQASFTYEGDTGPDDTPFVLTNNKLVYSFIEEYTSGADTYLHKYSTTFTRQ